MNSFAKTIISDNIVIYENVFDGLEDILFEILNPGIKWNLCLPTDDINLKHRKIKELSKKCYSTNIFKNKNLSRHISRLAPSLISCVKDFMFDKRVPSWYDDIEIIKYEPGNYIDEHYDSALNKNIKISVFFYLNDNYEGGEIVFTNKDISLKPKKNSVLVFMSTPDNMHKVNEIISGSKYVITTFIE